MLDTRRFRSNSGCDGICFNRVVFVLLHQSNFLFFYNGVLNMLPRRGFMAWVSAGFATLFARPTQAEPATITSSIASSHLGQIDDADYFRLKLNEKPNINNLPELKLENNVDELFDGIEWMEIESNKLVYSSRKLHVWMPLQIASNLNLSHYGEYCFVQYKSGNCYLEISNLDNAFPVAKSLPPKIKFFNNQKSMSMHLGLA